MIQVKPKKAAYKVYVNGTEMLADQKLPANGKLVPPRHKLRADGEGFEKE